MEPMRNSTNNNPDPQDLEQEVLEVLAFLESLVTKDGSIDTDNINPSE